MKNIRYIFPNAITLMNLTLGCAAITVALIGSNEYMAAWLIMFAAIFDLFDGWVARLLDARSEFGVQLDSLADMVSFGVAPSIIFFKWIILVLTNQSRFSTFELTSSTFFEKLLLLSAFLFALAAAVRLARFNITPSSGKIFKGLTTTASALIVSSLWIIIDSTESEIIRPILLNWYFVFSLLIILVFLMLSNIPMLSLKFKGASFESNKWQYILLLATMILLVIFGLEGIFFSLVFYLMLSFILAFIQPANTINK
jgi:CDP-diacylglycerol---serine O-phosphatidyltransferase